MIKEISSVKYGADDGLIVLCELTTNKVTPYATWYVNKYGERFWGDYFDNIIDAVDGFNSRVAGAS